MLANDARRLYGLQKEIQRLEVNEHVLKYTGIGYVVSDNMAWPPSSLRSRTIIRNERITRPKSIYIKAVISAPASPKYFNRIAPTNTHFSESVSIVPINRVSPIELMSIYHKKNDN